MADTKAKAAADAGQSEQQASYDEAAKKGYYGTLADPDAGKKHSLQSGPESPSPLEQHIQINEQRVVDQKASPGENS